MEKITESLEMLYGSSGTPFFLSDEFGNIKWKNTACGETIVFPKGINCDILTEQINIDGKEYSAQGTSFADGDKRFMPLRGGAEGTSGCADAAWKHKHLCRYMLYAFTGKKRCCKSDAELQ